MRIHSQTRWQYRSSLRRLRTAWNTFLSCERKAS
jgi:hypothetical protein